MNETLIPNPIVFTHTCNGFDIGRADNVFFVLNPVTNACDQIEGDLDDAMAYCMAQKHPNSF